MTEIRLFRLFARLSYMINKIFIFVYHGQLKFGFAVGRDIGPRTPSLAFLCLSSGV
jgi:hypothetical protein